MGFMPISFSVRSKRLFPRRWHGCGLIVPNYSLRVQ